MRGPWGEEGGGVYTVIPPAMHNPVMYNPAMHGAPEDQGCAGGGVIIFPAEVLLYNGFRELLLCKVFVENPSVWERYKEGRW